MSEIRKLYGKAEEALGVQVGGDHYSKLVIQPIQLVESLRMNYTEATVLKYITRHRDKGGEKDLEKALHIIDFSTHFKIVGIRTSKLSDEDEGLLAMYVAENNLDEEVFNIMLSLLNFEKTPAYKDLINYKNKCYFKDF